MIEEVPAALEGERLDRVVSMLTGVSRAGAGELVASGQVLINGEVVAIKAHRVVEGDELDIEVPRSDTSVPEPDDRVAFDVVHADPDVVVIDKPAGLVVHPGAGTPNGTLVNGLLARFPEMEGVGDPARPGIVHRLDRGTSGLLVVARSPAAYEPLVEALSQHDVERGYVALVWGTFDAPAGIIDAPIGRSSRSRTRMAVSARGKDARTQYTVRRRYDDLVEVSLLDLVLETGRTHQIRVHLAAIDHPVVGDEKYRGARTSLPLSRPFLHAARLSFVHPVRGERLVFSSPLPDDLSDILDSLD
jgi:23S rRNA pseudouridine1911/1915/1917 synthase